MTSSSSSENTPLLNGSQEGPCYVYSGSYAASLEEDGEEEVKEESSGYLKKASLALLVIFCIVCLNFIRSSDSEWEKKTLYKGRVRHMNVTADGDHREETINLRVKGPFAMTGTSTVTFCLSKIAHNGQEEKIYHSWIVLLDAENQDSQITLQHDFPLSEEEASESNTYQISIISEVNDIQLDIDLSIRPKLSIKKALMAVGIIIILHVLLIFELLQRSLAMMLSATLAVSCLALIGECPPIGDVMRWMNTESLCLVLGLLLFTSTLCETGFFECLAVLIYKKAGGSFWIVFNFLCASSALLSALLDPLSIIIFMTSLAFRLSESMNVDPKYILVALVHFSHFGSILRYSRYSFDIGFGRLLLHLLPAVFLSMMVSYGMWRFWLRDLSLIRYTESLEVTEVKREQEVWKRAHLSLSSFSREEANVKAILRRKVTVLDTLLKKKLYDSKVSADDCRENLKELVNTMKVKNRSLLYKSLSVGGTLVILLLLRNVPHFNLSSGWISLLGALLLLVLLEGNSVDSVFNRVEWPTLIFLASFYVYMKALENLDLVKYMMHFFERVMNVQSISIVILVWMCALSSTFAIPFPAVMMAALKNEDDGENSLIFALILGVYLGSNGSLVGGSVNILSAGMAEQHGCPYGYSHSFKLGFPVMLLTSTLSMAYLLMCHVWLGWNS